MNNFFRSSDGDPNSPLTPVFMKEIEKYSCNGKFVFNNFLTRASGIKLTVHLID